MRIGIVHRNSIGIDPLRALHSFLRSFISDGNNWFGTHVDVNDGGNQ